MGAELAGTEDDPSRGVRGRGLEARRGEDHRNREEQGSAQATHDAFLSGLRYGPDLPIWSYSAPNKSDLFSVFLSSCQRLPNGNTLITNSVVGECFEVRLDHEIVWSCSCGPVTLYRARRYLPDQLAFLKGTHHARP